MVVKLLFALLAAGIGAGLSVQASINTVVARGLGTTLMAATVSFTVGALILLAASAVLGQFGGILANWRSLPLIYLVLGGMFGATFIFGSVFLIPRIGVATLVVFVIAGQLTAAAIIDHYGLFGLTEQPISLLRVAGIAIVALGALVVWLA